MSRVSGFSSSSGPALPEASDKSRFVREMFDKIAPRYALVNTVMTFGQDRRWRVGAVGALGLDDGARVLDLACGPGEMCSVLATAGITAVGVDLSWGMLRAVRPGPGDSSPRVQGDAVLLPFKAGCFDGVTCAFGLRNFSGLPAVLSELSRVLRPGGRLAVLEVSQPSSKLLSAGHGFYFRRVVPMIGTLLSDRRAYEYLPASMAYLPSPVEMCRLFEDAGLGRPQRKLFAGGATQLLVATKAS